MNKKGRRRFSSEFKAKIAIEALQERNSIETKRYYPLMKQNINFLLSLIPLMEKK